MLFRLNISFIPSNVVDVFSNIQPMTTLICPQCGDPTNFSKKRGQYFCTECDLAFGGKTEVLPPRPKHTTTKSFKIFLSYGRDVYVNEVKALLHALRMRGHEVWFDDEQLGSGNDWEQRIEAGLAWCDRVVLTMTPHSVRRPDGYCLNEIAKALELRKQIIPLLLAEVPQGAPTSICRIQYLDWRDAVPATEKTERFLQRLARLCEAIEEDKLDFEGGQQRLIRHLQPLNFDGDLQRHIAGFKGRILLEARLRTWLTDPLTSKVLWLTAAPGLGKSAIAASLSHRWAEVGAVHFCVSGHKDKINPARAVLSIAYQLSQREHMDIYAKRLASLELERESHRDARSLFDTLLVGPLAKNFPEPPENILVILDGLDEATLSNGENPLAEIVAADWGRLPSWLRLMVSSRPEAELIQWLSSTERIDIRANDVEQQDDLLNYLRERLTDIGHHPSKEVMSTILQRSEGAFHYAALLIEEVRLGRCNPEDPIDLPNGLNSFYLQTFKRRFSDVSAYRNQIRPLLELILASPEPIPIEVLARATKRETHDARQDLSALGSMLAIDANEADANWDTVRLTHASLRSWLTGLDVTRQPFAGIFSTTVNTKGLAIQVLKFWEADNQQGKDWQDPAIERKGFVTRSLWSLLKEIKDETALERVAIDLSVYWEKKQLDLAIEPGVFAGNLAWNKFENEKVDTTSIERWGDCLKHLGDLEFAIGNSIKALIAYRKTQIIREHLVRKVSSNTKWQLDLCYIQNIIGKTLAAQGNLANALEEFQKSLIIGEKLVEEDPNNGSLQKNLSFIYTLFGDVYKTQGNLTKAVDKYQESLKIREQLYSGDKDSIDNLADLSVSYNRMGVVLEAQGKLDDSLVVHNKVLTLVERLVKKDPDNTNWQEYLVKSHNRIGSVLQTQGKFTESLEMFHKALTYAERLAALDSKNIKWKINLSNCFFYIGGVLKSENKLTQALHFSFEALKIMDHLAQIDPSNTELNFELSVYHSRIGSLLEQQENIEGAMEKLKQSVHTLELLVENDESNKKWKRDLSVAYSRIGDLLLKLNEPTEALNKFLMSLRIFTELNAEDSINVRTQYSLCLSHFKIGKAFEAQGKLTDAIAEFHKSILMIKELVAQDPSNANWQNDLRNGYFRIGWTTLKARNYQGALNAFLVYLELCNQLLQSKPHDNNAVRNVGYGNACLAWVTTLMGDFRNAEIYLALAQKTFLELVDYKDHFTTFDLAVSFSLSAELAERTENSDSVTRFENDLKELTVLPEGVKGTFREEFLSLVLARLEHLLPRIETQNKLDFTLRINRLEKALPFFEKKL